MNSKAELIRLVEGLDGHALDKSGVGGLLVKQLSELINATRHIQQRQAALNSANASLDPAYALREQHYICELTTEYIRTLSPVPLQLPLGSGLVFAPSLQPDNEAHRFKFTISIEGGVNIGVLVNTEQPELVGRVISTLPRSICGALTMCGIKDAVFYAHLNSSDSERTGAVFDAIHKTVSSLSAERMSIIVCDAAGNHFADGFVAAPPIAINETLKGISNAARELEYCLREVLKKHYPGVSFAGAGALSSDPDFERYCLTEMFTCCLRRMAWVSGIDGAVDWMLTENELITDETGTPMKPLYVFTDFDSARRALRAQQDYEGQIIYDHFHASNEPCAWRQDVDETALQEIVQAWQKGSGLTG